MKISKKELLDCGVQFGHLNKFKCPNMSKYIIYTYNNVNIINIEKTIENIENTNFFIEKLIKNNSEILFVGTKKSAKDLVKEYAEKCNMPYINNKWLGGLLTNFSVIKKTIENFFEFEQKFKDNISNNNLSTKKIQKKIKKLNYKFNGIRKMKDLPKAILVIDTKFEKIAVSESIKLNIPIIGIVDTNCDPKLINYPIPGNDDSRAAIKKYLEIISNKVIETKSKNESIIKK